MNNNVIIKQKPELNKIIKNLASLLDDKKNYNGTNLHEELCSVARYVLIYKQIMKVIK